MGLWWLALAGCDTTVVTCDDALPLGPPGGDGGNVLVLLLDDIGIDKVAAYGVHPTPSPMPNLDGLLDSGLRFDRAYASPTCSPTRASLLTGRHPSRHGIGRWILPAHDTWGLPDEEITLAELADDAGYATAAIGKWHMSVFDGHAAQFDPLDQGFDTFHGVLGNPDNAVEPDGNTLGYYHWERDDDGELSYTNVYLTTAQTDDAIDAMLGLPEPWFVYVGFSAAHVPLDLPPPSLATAASSSEVDLYDAVAGALDTEIGRLLAEMGELRDRTTILVLSDNGTPDHAIREPFDATHKKGTVTEGGVRVPFGISGPLVSRRTETSALVHAVDVFATVADLMGVDVTALTAPDAHGELAPVRIDGRSLVPEMKAPQEAPRRTCLLTEQFLPGGIGIRRESEERALIEESRKLVRELHDPDRVYRLDFDPREETEVDDEVARIRLGDEMRRYLRSFR